MIIDKSTEKARTFTKKQQEVVLRYTQSLYEPKE
jgi:hypothetical protein